MKSAMHIRPQMPLLFRYICIKNQNINRQVNKHNIFLNRYLIFVQLMDYVGMYAQPRVRDNVLIHSRHTLDLTRSIIKYFE